MVEFIYNRYKLHANLEVSAVAKIGAGLSSGATIQDFLPFPDEQQKAKAPISRETARIFIELRSLNAIPSRVWGAFADIESQIEEVARG